MRIINTIIIHCSATIEAINYTVENIRQWHLKRGFKNIGYHYVIYRDGTINDGRPISEPGAHCEGFNEHSVGICYIGGLDSNFKSKDTRTPEQKKALADLITYLKNLYPIKLIAGHRDFSADLNGDGIISKNEWMKDCPCFEVKDEFNR